MRTILVMLVLTGCLPRHQAEPASPEVIYISCEQQLRARDVKWAKVVKTMKDRVKGCEVWEGTGCHGELCTETD